MKKERLIVFFVTFFSLLVLSAIIVRGVGGASYKTENIELSDISVLSYNDIYRQGSEYIVKGSDPYIVLDTKGINQKLYGGKIVFKDDKKPNYVRVYYSNVNENFSEEKSTSTNVYLEYNFFSNESFENIRIDIDEDFEIEKIIFYVDVQFVNKDNTFGYLIGIIVSAVLAIVISCINKLVGLYILAYKRFIAKVKFFRENFKKISIVIMYIIAAVICSGLIELGIYKVFNKSRYSKSELAIIFALLLVAIVIHFYRKFECKKIEKLFFVLCLICGMLCIYISPRTVGVSWDDEIHYGKSAYMSYFCTNEINNADYTIIDEYTSIIYNKDYYFTRDGIYDYSLKMNQIYANSNYKLFTSKYKFDLQYVPYIPSALGLLLGRGLGMTFAHTFMLGKIFNLLTYSTILYFAIKLLKRKGKLIIATIGLIPTSVFLASSYAYDWWVNAFSILGYAMLIRELSEKDKEISIKKWIAMLLIEVIAFLPKAVYFPLIIPMIFILFKRCKNKKGIFVTLGILAMLVLIATFIFPMIFTDGALAGDARGGSNVNSAEQISFILHNPLKYTDILLQFIQVYTNFDCVGGYFTNFGYFGTGMWFGVVLIAIVVAAIYDNEKEYIKIGKLNTLVLILSIFATVSLVATALYISFTPVGYHTVNGCQFRYLFPIVFPAVYFLSRNKINVEETNSLKIQTGIMMIMSYVFIYNMFKVAVECYL